MEVTSGFFCDAATIDSTGKISVLGIFNNINGTEFPLQVPQVALVVVLNAQRAENGQHQIKVYFLDPDGQEFVPPIEGSFEITLRQLNCNFLFNFQGIKFPGPGVYTADVVVDNSLIRSLTFTVSKKS